MLLAGEKTPHSLREHKLSPFCLWKLCKNNQQDGCPTMPPTEKVAFTLAKATHIVRSLAIILQSVTLDSTSFRSEFESL